MTSSSNEQLEQKLNDYFDNSEGIRRNVLLSAIQHKGSMRKFFYDILHHGCKSKMIPNLICMKDTHQFFDEHYFEIEEIRIDYEYNRGLIIQGDLKNALAWFAFERTAILIGEELGLI